MRPLCILLALLFTLFPAAAIGSGAWSCDGTSNGYAEFDHNSAYNSLTYSISMWVKAGTAGSAYPAVISRNNESASVNWNWYVQITNGERMEAGWNDLKTGLSNYFETYTTTLVDGVWYRYQWRLRDETNRYTDHWMMGKGIETGSAQGQTNPDDFTAAPVQLCRLSVNGTYRYDFDGMVAHVEMFDVWLDDGAILFNLWHPGMMPANQVMYLPLTGTTIDDISATDNDPSTTGSGMAEEDDGPPLGWAGGLGY